MSSRKKILIFGKNGQLGTMLYKLLQDYALEAIDIPDVDFNQPESIAPIIDRIKPCLIINVAAYTAVDQAEKNRRMAFNINGQTVGKIAKKAKDYQAGFIHYSADYVFDGTKGSLYREDDSPNPINIYGESRLLGEVKTIQVDGSYLIFRLSWVYSLTNPSFVTKVLEWARENETLRIVDDQISNPTWALMVARMTKKIVDSFSDNWFLGLKEVRGVYHLAGKESITRYEWARAISDLDPNRHEQITQKLMPAKSDEFPTLAERPLYSGLDCSKFEQTFGLRISDWRSSLIKAMGGNQLSL